MTIWNVSSPGGALVLVVAVVWILLPSPADQIVLYALLGIGIAALVVWRRRKRA